MRKLHTHYTLGLVGAALVAGTATSSAQNESLLGGLTDGTSGELYAGYDSEYFYRGLFFGGDNVYTGIDLSQEICDGISAGIGAYYLDTVADQFQNYSEVGITASLSWDSGAGTFDLAATHFQFQNGFDGVSLVGIADAAAAGDDFNFRNGQQDATEVSLTYSTEDFYGFSAHAQGLYDFRIQAFYFEAGLGYTLDLGPASFDLNATVGYSLDGYYTGDDDNDTGLTHVLLTAALPFQITESLSFTPHISYNISLAARENLNNSLNQNTSQIFGGAALSVSF